MLKRFYSKRSGFTLVEIIVAMAIFAIMAAMVAQILQLSVKARQRNTAYGEELATQEERLTKVVKDQNDFQNKTSDYSLTFTGTDGTTEYPVTLAYEVKDAAGENTPEGINYFVSPVNYDGKFPDNGLGNSSGNSGNGGTQVGGSTATAVGLTTGLCNVRLSASKGMAYVEVKSVKKVSSSELSGTQVRYVFECAASSSGMRGVDLPYSEYKLYFYMNGQYDMEQSAVVHDAPDGSKYTNKVPLAAEIVNVGYCSADGTPTTRSNATDSYTVRGGGKNVVRIGVPFKDEGGNMNNYTSSGFDGSKSITFYVDFEQDPGNLTTASFGKNAAPSGTGHKYTLPSMSEFNNYVNVFVYGYDLYETAAATNTPATPTTPTTPDT